MSRLARPCRFPECPNLIQPGAECMIVAHRRKVTAPKPKTAARGDDAAWVRVSKAVLRRDRFVCQIRGPRCTGDATTCDHIDPLIKGGSRLDPDNLQAACRPCNSGKGGR